MEYYSTHYKSD